MSADTGQMFAVVRLIATLALEPATLTFTGRRSVIIPDISVPLVRLTGFSLSALHRNLSGKSSAVFPVELQETGNSPMLMGEGKTGNHC